MNLNVTMDKIYVQRKIEVWIEETYRVEETVSSEVSGGLLGLIKEAVGEVGSVDLTKVEEILSKILAILSTNGTVGSTRNSEMDAKLARIKELEAKQQLANEQKKTAEKKLSKRDREAMIEKLTVEMKDAARRLDFELAAYLRDKIRALREDGGK